MLKFREALNFNNNPVLKYVGALFLFLLLQKLLIYFGFHISFNDFYHKDNATWNITQGNGMYINLWGRSYLSNHFYPYHYLIALFYKLYNHPVWLLLFQVLCQTVMAWGILQIAYKKLGKKSLLTVTALLLLNYQFRRMNIEPLFGETVMAPLITWIIYGLLFNRHRLVFILTALMLFTKETAVTFIFMLSVYQILVKKQYGRALFWILISSFHAIYLIKFWMPALNTVNKYDFGNYYAYMGDGPMAILKTFCTRPDIIFRQILSGENALYTIALLMPFGFIALLNPIVLLGVGTYLQNILAERQPLMVDVGYHVSQPLLPILFISAIVVWAKIKYKKNTFTQIAKGFIYLSIILNIMVFIALDLRTFYISKNTVQNYEVMSLIPKDASVSTSKYLGSHLFHRPDFYRFPFHNNADYIWVDIQDHVFPRKEDPLTIIKSLYSNGEFSQIFKGLALQYTAPWSEYYEEISQLERNPNYTVISRKGQTLLFKRIK